MMSMCCSGVLTTTSLTFNVSSDTLKSSLSTRKVSIESSFICHTRAKSIIISAANVNPCLSASRASFLRGDYDRFTLVNSFVVRQRNGTMRGFHAPRASKDVPYSFRYPPMTKKPGWWWRSLACIPYLLPACETWMNAETAYSLHPFLEDFEYLTLPFLRNLGRLPNWFFMAYFFVAYLGIVRKKQWPHFLRFHVIMGMLLEIALQIIGTLSRWLPLSVYWGRVGAHLWTAVAFSYLLTVFQCAMCALRGTYADVPFVSDAAYIQIPYD